MREMRKGRTTGRNRWNQSPTCESRSLRRGSSADFTLTNGNVVGLMMTYVDDMFLVGSEPVVSALQAKIQSVWKTSDRQWVSEEPVRFLVKKRWSKVLNRDEWLVAQESYTKEIAMKAEGLVERKVPIARHQSSMEEEEKPSAEMVRWCQKAVGEALWLMTRTRPDIMFTVSKMGGGATKSANQVKEIAAQLKGYLKRTSEEGLRYEEKKEEEVELEAFSDASFAPGGEASHGSFIIMVNRCPLLKYGQYVNSWSQTSGTHRSTNSWRVSCSYRSRAGEDIQKKAWSDSFPTQRDLEDSSPPGVCSTVHPEWRVVSWT